tara:strand:- start:2901 stop:3137 length:237 start_codon:yes stop_codon:yes gene_type:complete
MKNRKPCKDCNRPYSQHIKGKPYCILHLREMGILKYPRKRISKEGKELYIFYPRFMWEEKIRYTHKLVKDTMREMENQ